MPSYPLGRDEQGEPSASDVYLYRVQTQEQVLVEKIGAYILAYIDHLKATKPLSLKFPQGKFHKCKMRRFYLSAKGIMERIHDLIFILFTNSSINKKGKNHFLG